MRRKDSIGKEWDTFKCTIHKIKGIAMLAIQMSNEKRNITIDGQVIAKIDASGILKYNRF